MVTGTEALQTKEPPRGQVSRATRAADGHPPVTGFTGSPWWGRLCGEENKTRRPRSRASQTGAARGHRRLSQAAVLRYCVVLLCRVLLSCVGAPSPVTEWGWERRPRPPRQSRSRHGAGCTLCPRSKAGGLPRPAPQVGVTRMRRAPATLRAAVGICTLLLAPGWVQTPLPWGCCATNGRDGLPPTPTSRDPCDRTCGGDLADPHCAHKLVRYAPEAKPRDVLGHAYHPPRPRDGPRRLLPACDPVTSFWQSLPLGKTR